MGRLEPNLAKSRQSHRLTGYGKYGCVHVPHHQMPPAWPCSLAATRAAFFRQSQGRSSAASACHSPHEFCPHIDPIPSEDGDDFHSLAHSRSRVRDTRSRASAVSVTRDAPHVEPIMAAREFVITSSRRLRHIARDSRARCDQAMDRAKEEGGREPRLQAQFTHCGH
jgi:hypothetical protein